MIHQRCKMTRRAFLSKYFYQRISSRSGDGSYSEIPQKIQGYGDLMDALQYGCFEIEKGLDLTSDGQRRIGGRPAIVRNDSDFDVLRGVG